MPNPRITSTRAAARTTRELKRLFDKLGSRDHPRGLILAAYRNAHRGLRDIAKRHPKGGIAAAFETREVLNGLERDVRATASETLGAAATLGTLQGDAEAAAWGLQASSRYVDIAPAVDAVAGVTEAQAKGAMATIVTDGDWARVMGDDTRSGILWPVAAIKSGTLWLAIQAAMAMLAQIEPALEFTETDWGKQTVPVIDNRTTDCCLRAAGQVVRFESKFKLTGTPRYSDKMEWTPFHDYCRTSVVMVPMDRADDDVTAKIAAMRDKELKLRRDAKARIKAIYDELVKANAMPDAIKRAADTDQITALRRELKGLRQRGKYPES